MSDDHSLVRLHPDSIAAIVEGVFEMLEREANGPAETALVDASEIAQRLGRSPAWVRSRAHELGGIRLGSGPRPRHAFDPEVAMAMATVITSDASTTSPPSAPEQASRRAPRRTDAPTTTRVPLLPIRGVPA